VWRVRQQFATAVQAALQPGGAPAAAQ